MSRLRSLIDQFIRDWRSRARWAASFCTTIRGRILVAFLVMSAITGALGGYAVWGIQDAGVLVRKTFDESLMSINYARAAATDFATMRAVFARRWIADDPQLREDLDDQIAGLAKTLKDDLAIAAKRSQSTRAKEAALNVQRAVDAWKDTSEHLLDKTKLDASWDQLDRYAAKVDQQVDLLINYTAGDGFLYRQSAIDTVAHDLNFNIAGTALALLMSGLVAWTLARRIIRPVATASNVAECIATGKLDVLIPAGGTDELGTLLASMRSMRDNIGQMMDREVAQRRSAQTRLADALDSSQEGVVVVDAAECIALANAQAVNLLGLAPELMKPGTRLSHLRPNLDVSLRDGGVLTRRDDGLPPTGNFRLAGGKWLRISQSATRDGGFIVVCSDISHAMEQEADLRKINLRLDAALDNMSQGLCLFDGQGRLEVVNRRFFEIFGLSRELIRPGLAFSDVLELGEWCRDHDNQPAIKLLAEQTQLMSRHETGTHYYELSDGRVIASAYSPTSNGGWVATFEDVTERRQAEARIIHMARHDALTDLPNRSLFRERIERGLSRGEKLAILFVDLDRFKTVNDTLGHPIGDALLCAVTKRLQKAVRGSDMVARLGGDEFAVIQLGAKPTDASELASRIIEALSEPFELMGNQVIIGASIGIAIAPTDGREPDQLLRNSDMALYRAKGNGRGTYHFFQPEMDAEMQARHVLEVDLRKAMLAGEFELYYQPIVSVASGKIVGCEALIRWNHPQRGLVTPDDFIPIAEEIGLIAPLGEWVLRQACRDAAAWPGIQMVAVNLSAVQFRNQTLALNVASALNDSGLDPRRLVLEITETVLLQNNSAVLDTLHQIRDLGVKISMDDFGTGYSSLSYLRKFPFDKIKIDRSFIRELGKKDDCRAIIRAITRLASSLGMVTIAEGVETNEQLEILRIEGCTQVQGFLLSAPTSAREIVKLLRPASSRARVA
jgi:diguanylate cyclase (GGDEF)-like protein/PAS domain S-box-containing protein